MTTQDIINQVAAGTITAEDAGKLIATMNEQSKGQPRDLSFKVSEKGALSVYGLQRMPVTLYVEQWDRFMLSLPKFTEFRKANDKAFTRKADKANAS